MDNTKDILDEFKRKYREGDFRIAKNGSKTVEIQNAHFVCDKPWIIREPNEDYLNRELEWYLSESLMVDDIPGGAPKIWKRCANIDGMINSNYGWCIFSPDNGKQYEWCKRRLIDDPTTREACMIYNRPSMQWEATELGMHDFMCTYAVQCFLNDISENKDGSVLSLKYIVYMRSNDAVFGFGNDAGWHLYVQNRLVEDLNKELGRTVVAGPLEWNAGSIHVYEMHFKYLEN